MEGISEIAKDQPAVLLVDDRAANLRALISVFGECDYRLVCANSGEEALKHMLTDEFAVVLLDVQMPGLDGFETAKLIRSRRRSRDTPIIFITAINKEDSYVFRGYAAGAVDYVFKPFEPEILRAKVAVFVELFRKNREVALQAELLRRIERRERDRTVAELRRASDQRYRRLADAVPQLVWTSRADGGIEYANARWLEYTGMSEDALVTTRLYELMHEEDTANAVACQERAVADGGAFRFEARFRRASDGVYRWHLIQVVPEMSSDGDILSWLGTATDIDDEKRTASDLADEKERLAVTLRSIGDGVMTVDNTGCVEVMNRAAEALTGWTQDKAVGRKLTEVLNLNLRGKQSDAVELLQSDGIEVAGEGMQLMGPGGKLISISRTAAPIVAADGHVLGTVIVLRDETDKQRLEDERLKASKLESIGLLAGAIAHDFNNILTAILGNISLAKLYLPPDDRAGERLTEAEKASLWARDLTQQLLTFSRGGAPVRKTVAIDAIVRDAVSLAAGGSHIRCELSLATDLWPVEADEGQMRQVLHNLVLNAQQAMPRGGCIKVSAENREVRRKHRLPLPPGRYVRLCCEDHGVGIPMSHLSRVFDPYFTTKQRGSGLGLTTTYSIIKRHEGLITVESEVGKGTKFWIYLPASDQQPVLQLSPSVSSPSSLSGRILVMDDEAYIRDLLATFLGHLGCDVAVAEDGGKAITLYQQARSEGRPFDVVIMDLIVPGGMGGREAMERLLAIDPAARVIVSSGYSNDPVMSEFARYGFRDAVSKPYKNEELQQAVQRLLAERHASAA